MTIHVWNREDSSKFSIEKNVIKVSDNFWKNNTFTLHYKDGSSKIFDWDKYDFYKVLIKRIKDVKPLTKIKLISREYKPFSFNRLYYDRYKKKYELEYVNSYPINKKIYVDGNEICEINITKY